MCPQMIKPASFPSLLLALFTGFVSADLQAEQENPDQPTAIQGSISDGTPAPPAERIPLPAFTIQNTFTRKLDVVEPPELAGLPPVAGRITATVHLVEDPGLPDPPPPPAPAPDLSPETLELLRSLRESREETRLVFVSATVYDHSRTLLTWYSNGQPAKQYKAWSNLDYNHFSGFSSYQVEGRDGVVRTYCLLMGIGNVDSERTKAFQGRHGIQREAPEIPALPDLAAGGPLFTVIEGDRSDPEAMRVIEDMHLLYQTEGGRMAEAHIAREAAYRARYAYLLVNPPKPEDVEIHFWKRHGSNASPLMSRGLDEPTSGPEDQPPPTFTKGTSGTWKFDWEGVEGRTYFLQWSLDLVTWNYAPIIEHGSGMMSFGGTSSSPKLFLRLRYTDQVTSDVFDGDFDGDRISNWYEVTLGLDPLDGADRDSDGIPDNWETYFLLNPGSDADALEDRDGDGISNLDEFLAGTDPTDFYNGDFPTVTVVSGNSQYAEPGQFTFKPMVVEVRKDGILQVDVPIWIESIYSSPALVSLTNDGNGLVTRILARTDSNGQVAAYAKHGLEPVFNYISMAAGSEIDQRIGPTLSTTTKVRMIYPSGTIGREATDIIDSLIAGKDPGAAMPVFSTQDHANSAYVRNTQCWAYGLAQPMTCISPWNNLGQGQMAGVAITRRHVLNAAHFPFEVGTVIRFVTADNTVVERTVAGRAIHPAFHPDPPYPDLAVYTLDQDLPSSITPCEILPPDYATWLGPLGNWQPPVLALDQEENAVVMDFRVVRQSGDGTKTWAEMTKPTLPAERAHFHKIVTTGDSGNPAFLVLDNRLLLLTVWSTGSLGTFTTAHLADINSLISTADTQAGVSTGLQATAADLNAYTPFNP